MEVKQQSPNAAPLDQQGAEKSCTVVTDAFPSPVLAQRSGALRYPGGIPTSLKESGQQWDYPNAWPPLQHMLIDGRHRPRWISRKHEGHIQCLCARPLGCVTRFIQSAFRGGQTARV